MAADNGEDEAVLDVKVPSRRRRASDDEADEAEFHDAAEYAASVADSQALDRGEDAIQEVHSGSSNEDDGASGSDAEGEEHVAGTEEQAGEASQEDQFAADRKKAKIREPFEVPTSGAFWLHDDRLSGEEQPGEPPRPSNTMDGQRKARSDTQGRWLHDKFNALELDEDAGDDSSDNAFSYNRRSSGRDMRGGRRGGGGRSSPTAGTRSRGRMPGRGRGRSSLYATGVTDGYSSEPGETAPVPAGPSPDTQEALPQRQSRASLTLARSAAAQGSSQMEDVRADASAGGSYVGSGRGRGQGARGGRASDFNGLSGRGAEFTGLNGRDERSFSPDASAERALHYSHEAGTAGRSRGLLGRGRGREDRSRADGPYDRGISGRDASRGYSRAPDAMERGQGGPELGASNGAVNDGARGRGRGASRASADFQGRGSGPGRGPVGVGRNPPVSQRQYMAETTAQQQRKPNRTLDEDFPPLPGIITAKRPAASLDMPPGVSSAAVAQAATEPAAPATQGVRRYSKMAGKAAGGPGDAGSGMSGNAAGQENGRARAAGGDAGAAQRPSKLSAAAPTFEPSPPAAPGTQSAAQQQQTSHEAPPSVPAVPVAFGAPLQPMTVIATVPPAQPVGMGQDEYGAGVAPHHGQHMTHMPPQSNVMPPQQHSRSPQQPVQSAYGPLMQPLPAQQQQQVAVSMPPPRGIVTAGSPVAPQQQQQGGGGGMPHASMGAMMYGASPTEVEAWYQDAYQKALATGMDPQQAYSAVQGYVQGLSMAYAVVEQQRQQQVVGSYPVGVQQPQQMPQGPPPQGP